MANRFRKAPQADQDLDSIWDFIASDSVRAADQQIARIGEIFEMLLESPLAGRERRELRLDLRSFAVGNYVIFYVPLPDGIEVIRVMHGRQDIGADDMQ
ncbi:MULTISPECIES: type II toxin-antitoxin system RelE/ParE family toxin [unclassified Bradyrhizobium]|uniref:type II toxin-antitoxin system RelE/ParE family toxin n=1 Tax=unclassified Bradyrhizobium TaxID=2631580 RepID=UPI0020B1AD82|nr:MULTISPECIES: type II toxin-antitoxin system RelE/ParE family toxin [unclassified Bradyrhizobium]MCP3379246.1 type II toxin-antitoxin system RelE/ParE family toxin [Bradyrhizobium sp. CCGUVB4N]MCP3439996.1 type II toxin-antitoxin system RelE/ParE family toxin [Bradyrhizobium sp. CCGUVB14]WFU81625.1 type II toxin-antitoxin system RelE/ParE family toxin [Bradyrhizobium sp. CIAT3101]